MKKQFLIWCAAALLGSCGSTACDPDHGETAANAKNAAAEKESDKPADLAEKQLQIEINKQEVKVVEHNDQNNTENTPVKMIQPPPQISVKSPKK